MRTCLLAALLLVVNGPLSAQPVGLTGVATQEHVNRVLAGIDWQRDLNAVLARAAEQQKPVFWLQMVGDLSGGL